MSSHSKTSNEKHWNLQLDIFVRGISAKPLKAPLTHPTLPVWTLQIISHLTPEPTNHLKERSASWLASPQLKCLEFCAGCCLKHKRRGRVAAERAFFFL